MAAADVEERVLGILRQVAGTDQVLRDREMPLYSSGILDSLATVTLIAALSEELGVEVSPAEFDQAAWATPRLLVEDVTARLAALASPASTAMAAVHRGLSR